MAFHAPGRLRTQPVSAVERGRLLDASDAPATGERAEEMVRVRNLVIEQVLSGTVAPVDYDQDEDEFAVVLEGAAVLDVAAERVELSAGDWVLLPARTPHRLLHTEPGTSWLTVKLFRDELRASPRPGRRPPPARRARSSARATGRLRRACPR